MRQGIATDCGGRLTCKKNKREEILTGIFVVDLDVAAQAALERSILIAESRCGNFRLYIDSQCCQGPCLALADKRHGVYSAMFNPSIEDIMLMAVMVGLHPPR